MIAGKGSVDDAKMCMSLWEKSPLFEGLLPSEIPPVLRCLDAFRRRYEKGVCILDVGDELFAVGILFEGEAHIHKDDGAESRNLVMELRAGDMFGETALCAGIRKSPFRVTAASVCEVLFLRMDRILQPTVPPCRFRSRLVENLLKWIAEKNLELGEKLDIVSRRSLRDRIRVYLSRQAELNGSPEFRIPFSRRDMADYLYVDRSALSRELSRMKEEGLIDFERNRFRLGGAFSSGVWER